MKYYNEEDFILAYEAICCETSLEEMKIFNDIFNSLPEEYKEKFKECIVIAENAGEGVNYG